MQAEKTLADKFRDMAAALMKQVEEKRRPRRTNTPKQNKQANQARFESDHLERAAKAMIVIADARDDRTLPASLAGMRTKQQFLDFTRTILDNSGGYYSLVDTGKYAMQSGIAVFFREWVNQRVKLIDDKIAKQREVERLENTVRFSAIDGFFPTPPEVIRLMLEHAKLEPGMKVLEPSAGKGDIVEALVAAGCDVTGVEINRTLWEICQAKGLNVVRGDFLDTVASNTRIEFGGDLGLTPNEIRMNDFDRVVMNPPFERGQDIDHVMHAMDFLKPDGILVAVMSAGPWFRSDRKSVDFMSYLYAGVGSSKVIDLGDAFASDSAFRKTSVNTKLLVLRKAGE